MSSVTSFVWKRSVGVIGRNDLIGIVPIPLPRYLLTSSSSAIHDALFQIQMRLA
jgi:hypothetical protein